VIQLEVKPDVRTTYIAAKIPVSCTKKGTAKGIPKTVNQQGSYSKLTIYVKALNIL